jgi:hypothetical protein
VKTKEYGVGMLRLLQGGTPCGSSGFHGAIAGWYGRVSWHAGLDAAAMLLVAVAMIAWKRQAASCPVKAQGTVAGILSDEHTCAQLKCGDDLGFLSACITRLSLLLCEGANDPPKTLAQPTGFSGCKSLKQTG